MKTYYLYYLIDPNTNEVRYIGITYRPVKRYKEHLYYAIKAKTHKDKWILMLLNNNQKPILKIIYITNNRDEILEHEITHIANHKNLTNSTTGGDYFTFSLDTIEKLSNRNKGANNPCYKRVWTTEEKQKLTAMRKGRKLDTNWRKSIGKNMPNRKEIIINGITYYSHEEAMRVLKLNHRQLHRIILNNK
jgi:hypothetical protein